MLLLIGWCSNQTLVLPEDQFPLLGITLAVFAIGILLKKRMKGSHLSSTLRLDLTIAASAFVAIFRGWNIFFSRFSLQSDFKGNIFRGAFDHLRAPMYGHNYLEPFSSDSFRGLAVLVFICLFCFWFYKKKFNFDLKHWFPLFAILLIAFSWKGSLYETLLSNNCHYETLANDKDAFSSISDILLNFTQTSSSLSVHNNHYPPGNLILLKMETYAWPFVLKPLVLLSTLLSLIPLYRLMALLNLNKVQIFYSLLLFITSGSVLFFPEIDPSALMLPVVVLGVFYILKYVQNYEIRYSVLFGIMVSVYLFFSFMSLFYGFFCFILLFVLFINKKISIRQTCLFAFPALFTIVGIYILVRLASGFDLYNCFLNSFENEKKQMTYAGIGDLTRYLIVSTGNLIAYLCVLGIPATAVLIIGLKEIRLMSSSVFHILGISLLITVLAITFSNQFFLETERIWIIFTPFVFIIAGFILEKMNYLSTFINVYFILFLSLLTTLYLGLNIDFCY
ncbi:MAG: hypothetical protein K0Q95_617 [Bacteroidota bacterium]|jgi:hypothetical protein|nr:hypothetical protein [Bacteroidota bacterium]